MKKRISQIIAFCVLAAVVLSVVFCAIIKIDFMPQMKLPEYPEVIQITDAEAGGIYESLSEDTYKNFVIKFNDSFKLSVLNSLFSGKIGKKIETPVYTSKNPNTISGSGYQVLFVFAEEQTLKDNGKEVTVAKNSTETVKFNRLKFYVEADKGLNENITLYFYNNLSYYYSIKTMANFDALYNFIKDIPMFAD